MSEQSERERAVGKSITQLPPEEAEEIESLGAVVALEEEEAAPAMMKIDLHCHSEASADCVTPIEKFPERCLARGISVQAITDHNEIWGAQKLKALVQQNGHPLRIIVGEEVSTDEGEIIGLFLKEKIEPGLTPEETVTCIQQQGGLVLLPHGFDPLKRFRLKDEARARIRDQIQIVETFNARISRPTWNRAAVAWAEKHGCLMSAGSDSHTLADIGEAWVEVPARSIDEPADLLAALEGGVPVGVWTHPVLAYGYKLWDGLRNRLRSWVKR